MSGVIQGVHSAGLLDLDFTLGSFLQKPLAEKNAAARPELLAHIVYGFR
jgi:hypothetical protein